MKFFGYLGDLMRHLDRRIRPGRVQGWGLGLGGNMLINIEPSIIVKMLGMMDAQTLIDEAKNRIHHLQRLRAENPPEDNEDGFNYARRLHKTIGGSIIEWKRVFDAE